MTRLMAWQELVLPFFLHSCQLKTLTVMLRFLYS